MNIKKKLFVSVFIATALVAVLASTWIILNLNNVSAKRLGKCVVSCSDGSTVSCEGEYTSSFKTKNDAGCICDEVPVRCSDKMKNKNSNVDNTNQNNNKKNLKNKKKESNNIN